MRQAHPSKQLPYFYVLEKMTMRVLHVQLLRLPSKFFMLIFRTAAPLRHQLVPVLLRVSAFMLVSLGVLNAESPFFTSPCLACDNVLTGGKIQGNESGCPAPVWDPSAITSVSLPAGGSGNLEYVWMATTDEPTSPLAQWMPLPNSNGPSYDPGPVSVTTYYKRFARRSGCTDYVGESNVVTKTAICCENVTDGGVIGLSQHFCGILFNPDPINNLEYPSGGSGDYEYQWLMSLKGTPYYPGSSDWLLIAGANGESYDLGLIVQNTYLIRLARSYGCVDYTGISNIVTLSVSPAVAANITGKDISCKGGSDGSINLHISGGTAPFQFQWNPNLGNVEDPQGLSAGYYAVTTTDAMGCSAISAVTLQDGAEVVLKLEGTDETCLGVKDGTAQILSAGGGTPNYTFHWNDPQGQSGPLITNLSPGSYTVTATDAAGCTATATIAIAAGPPLGVSVSSTDETCFHAANGTAGVTQVVGGVPGYSYKWNDPQSQTGSAAILLPAGNFTVTVTDSQGCFGTAEVTIQSGPPLKVSVQSIAETCLGGNNGSAQVTSVNGGLPAYTYQWDDPLFQTGQSAAGLSPGIYTVTATDAQGCIGSSSIAVESGPPLVVVVLGTAESCFGANNGTAAVLETTGGSGDLSYLWSDPFSQTTPAISSLPVGSYTVLVTDTQGCTGSAVAQVDYGPMLEVVTTANGVSCFGGSDGSATVVSVSGGSGFYSYQWGDPNFQTTQTATDLTPGVYDVIVNDSQGCAGFGAVAINEGTQLVVATTHTPAQCNYTADGTATASVSGGVAPYSYLWSDPAAQTGITAIGLVAGAYAVTVTDAQGCTVVASETVEAPVAATLLTSATGASCAGASDGTVSVSIVNGNPADFSYLWDDPAASTSTQVSGLPQGAYSVTVSDGNGCLSTGFALVSEPPAIALTMQADSASCANGSDGSAAVLASGGTPFGNGYHYAWNAPGEPTVSALDDISPGFYTVTVTDSQGCTSTGAVEIAAPAPLELSLTSTQVSCAGMGNGSTTALVTGGTLPYTYEWSIAADSTSPNISGLGPGTYGLTVTDAKGCYSISQAVVFEPPALNLTIIKTDLLCANNSSGAAYAQVGGGVAPYTFKWSNGKTTTDITNLAAGSYQLTVTDGNGCTVSDGISILTLGDLSSTVTATGTTCYDAGDGTATASGQGGVSPYTYLWSNASTGSTIYGLAGGVYTVTITDANGCTVQNSVQVETPPAFSCQVQLVSPISFYGGNDGIASAAATGGTAPYTFNWANGSAEQTVSALPAGVQSVTVTDSKGCTCTAQLALVNPSRIGNFVWHDINQNGIQDPGEPGVANVLVKLFGTTGSGVNVALSTLTDANGEYTFDGLQAGAYSMEVSLPANCIFSAYKTGNTAQDSDIHPETGSSDTFQLAPSFYDDRWDAGLIFLDEKSSIGDWVWEDFNRNGIQDLNEPGIAEVQVKLIAMPGNTVVASTVTDDAGQYLFEEVQPGTYVVEFSPGSLPDGYVFTSPHQGTDDGKDSDPDPVTGRSPKFQVLPFAQDKLSIDAGLFKECDNLTDSGAIGYDENFCGPEVLPTPMTSLVQPSGGSGVIEYRWLASSVPIYNGDGDANWKVLPNSGFESYNPGVISETTYFIRSARRKGCTAYSVQSNIVAKSLAPYPLAKVIEQPAELCILEESRFEAANAGAGAAYFWEFGADAAPSTATARVADPVFWSTAGLKTVRLSVTRQGCSQSAVFEVKLKSCGEDQLVFDQVSAVLNGDKVAISWKVSGDASKAVFFVQRSEDGQSFENMTAMAGAVGQNVSTYSATDGQPKLGENYYRIQFRMIDDTGREGLSQGVEVFYHPEGVDLVQVYPNPTFSETTLQLLRPNDFPTAVLVTTPFGKVLNELEIPANSEKLTLDLRSFSQGIYLVYIKQKGHREQVRRVVKLK